MLSHFVAEVKTLIARLEASIAPAESAIITEAEVIGNAAFQFIKTQGLQELYLIAKNVLLCAATGEPWATTLAQVVKEGETAGIAILKGAEAVVVAQAQADLIAAGKLAPAVPA